MECRHTLTFRQVLELMSHLYFGKPVNYTCACGQKCELSLALFVVVMFIGCLNRGGRAYHWLKPVRSELSIVAWFLSLGHMAVYLESYLPRLLGGGEIGGNVMGAFVLAVVLLVLVIGLNALTGLVAAKLNGRNADA